MERKLEKNAEDDMESNGHGLLLVPRTILNYLQEGPLCPLIRVPS